MKVQEMMALANEAPGHFTEKDVSRYFNKVNIGHWPSEKSKITLSVEDGDVEVLVKPNNITVAGHEVTPAGRIWLLTQFFATFPPEPLNTIENLNKIAGEPASAKNFIKTMRKRLVGRCELVKMDNKRIAYTENVIRNSDGSNIFLYETMDMDVDNSERLTVMIPGAKPVIMVYFAAHGKVSRFIVNYQGQQIEELEGWERAAISTEWPSTIFPTEPVTQPMIDKLFKIFHLPPLNSTILETSRKFKHLS